ncbi:hypothetical protein M758_7G116200 [Ceratodon purpureus]|uniref:Uncharacterized protein n=1 Tax=Ceratodon purpureus TaxID=3225 RepID=A0A8T0H771_CERPU|nr:hypothetical protein KC19_7G160200 [Ceratodon purpureus]KAG0611108.1 hypothetical protein M758_7G116200 [Ceratodon purpureus]
MEHNEMSRRCSHCGLNGHNSRTCPDRGVRLFGVRLTDGVSSMNMRKSVSMNNLSHYASTTHNPPSPPEHSESGATPDGYVSDGLVQTSNNARERKKGVPWTEDEHRLFLLGLQKLGKGDWRGISRNFVQTRTPTQVASHAQKYFIRQSNLNKRKRRSSLFDIVSESGVPSIAEESTSIAGEIHGTPLHELSLGPSSMYSPGVGLYESTSMQGYGLSVRPFSTPKHMSLPMALPLMSIGNSGAVTADQVTEVVGMGYNMDNASRSGIERSVMGMRFNRETPIRSGIERPVGGLSYNIENSSRSDIARSGVSVPHAGPSLSLGGSSTPSRMPYSFNSWPGLSSQGFTRPGTSSSPNSNIVRPTAKVAVVSASPVKMEEDSRDIAQLSLGLSPPEPSQLTAKLLDPPSRHSSAFHVNSSFDANSLQQGVNAINVV